MYEYPGLDELLEEAADAARGHGHALDPNALAGLALELAAIHTAVDKALEPLKEKLREAARDGLRTGQNSGTVTIDGYYTEDGAEGDVLGTVTVTFPPKQVKLPRGADVSALKRTLGPAFSEYFETNVSYRPKKGLPNTLKERRATGEATQTEVQRVLSAVSYVDPTPRVGFKPSSSVGPEKS
jgi:hypothetical protein